MTDRPVPVLPALDHLAAHGERRLIRGTYPITRPAHGVIHLHPGTGCEAESDTDTMTRSQLDEAPEIVALCTGHTRPTAPDSPDLRALQLLARALDATARARRLSTQAADAPETLHVDDVAAEVINLAAHIGFGTFVGYTDSKHCALRSALGLVPTHRVSHGGAVTTPIGFTQIVAEAIAAAEAAWLDLVAAQPTAAAVRASSPDVPRAPGWLLRFACTHHSRHDTSAGRRHQALVTELPRVARGHTFALAAVTGTYPAELGATLPRDADATLDELTTALMLLEDVPPATRNAETFSSLLMATKAAGRPTAI